MKRGEQSRTIWAPYEAFYIQSMLFNAESAVRSVSNISDVLQIVMENSSENPISALPAHHLLNELQNFILQAASLSRYFWPVRRNHEWRGNQLRIVFRISEDNPLRSRELRNTIEHFDEQLDKYLENQIVGYIIPQYVGFYPESESVPHHFFRAYYIDRNIFELLGKQYEISPLSEEVARLYEQLKRMDNSGSRLKAHDV